MCAQRGRPPASLARRASPPADALAGDGNAYLKREGARRGGGGGRMRRRSDVIRVKTRDISHLQGLMEWRVTVVMDERGNPRLQGSFFLI